MQRGQIGDQFQIDITLNTPKIGVKTPKWMVKIVENPIKMDDLGENPLFSETSIFGVWVNLRGLIVISGSESFFGANTENVASKWWRRESLKIENTPIAYSPMCYQKTKGHGKFQGCPKMRPPNPIILLPCNSHQNQKNWKRALLWVREIPKFVFQVLVSNIFMFSPTSGNDPIWLIFSECAREATSPDRCAWEWKKEKNWLIFLEWVETTNLQVVYICSMTLPTKIGGFVFILNPICLFWILFFRLNLIFVVIKKSPPARGGFWSDVFHNNISI